MSLGQVSGDCTPACAPISQGSSVFVTDPRYGSVSRDSSVSLSPPSFRFRFQRLTALWVRPPPFAPITDRPCGECKVAAVASWSLPAFRRRAQRPWFPVERQKLRRSPYNDLELDQMKLPSTSWIALFLVSLIVGLLQVLPQWHRRRVSASWPMVKAIFGSGSVTQERVSKGEFSGVVFLTEIFYSYSVLGIAYSGRYSEQFRTRDEAEQMLRSFKQGPLFVRYNPAAPADYFMDPYRDVRET